MEYTTWPCSGFSLPAQTCKAYDTQPYKAPRARITKQDASHLAHLSLLHLVGNILGGDPVAERSAGVARVEVVAPCLPGEDGDTLAEEQVHVFQLYALRLRNKEPGKDDCEDRAAAEEQECSVCNAGVTC